MVPWRLWLTRSPESVWPPLKPSPNLAAMPRPPQRTLPWPTALREILTLLGPDRPAIVGIGGPVASGKTTLAAGLAGSQDAGVISTDSYLPDYDAIPDLERDLPERAELALLASHLAELRAGREADIPIWSFHSHRREGARRVAPAPLIIVEGIHALHELVAPHLDVRVFVDAPREVRWRRWEVLETSGHRGMGVERAREHFQKIAEPTFERYAATYRASAHLIIVNPGG
jgi:uridine kinase